MGRLHPDGILAQGQSRDGPYLARGARDRADPPAYGGPGLRPAAALVPRRHDARIWTDLLWRHWDDWRAGKRQHLFLVTLAGNAKDITTIDHDVPTIATSGDGDVAVAPDGREIAFAMHGDSSVADNTNVDIY